MAVGLAGCKPAEELALRIGSPQPPAETRPPRLSTPPAAAGPASPASPGWRRRKLSPREVRFLEVGLEQIRRHEGKVGQMYKQPLAAGSLAAAALAADDRPDAAALREDTVRWIAAALDLCSQRWHTNKCTRAQLPLQRVVLQYPQVLPADLLARLRAEVAAAAPPPGEAAVRHPWGFRETENQRMLVMARSLVGQTVAGTPDSPAARGWGAYAEAFLLAHDRDGWYEAESPGYLAVSINGLLQLADHAPQASVRGLAKRQLDLLFADWAQEQVGGFPAGAKSRTYHFWAMSDRGVPWPAWAWLVAGVGKPERISFMDRPELATSGYEMPPGVVRLLAERRRQPPYEIRARRHIQPDKRRDLDTALYSYATPDYILGAAQSVGGLTLKVSGRQEIVATLYAEGPEFAPLYLWSRTHEPRAPWESWMGEELAVAHRNLLLARVGVAGREGAVGHAYLGAPWSQPEIHGDTVFSRYGDTYVALVTVGGWDVAPARRRFPVHYGKGKEIAGAWVAVPRRQPAGIALEAGRRADHGEFGAWKAKVLTARLRSEVGELRYTASDGIAFTFVPGERAAVAGRPLAPREYPRLAGPFLSSPQPGHWKFSFGGLRHSFEPLSLRSAP